HVGEPGDAVRIQIESRLDRDHPALGSRLVHHDGALCGVRRSVVKLQHGSGPGRATTSTRAGARVRPRAQFSWIDAPLTRLVPVARLDTEDLALRTLPALV